MDLTFELINGLSFGLEYIGKDADDGIEESAVMATVGPVRCIIWLGDREE